MICKKCGAELRPGALYCQACGADAVPAPFLDTDPVPGADKKNRRRGRRAGVIALVVCLVILAAVGAVFHRVIAEFFLRTFRSPADYYQHVEARAIDDLSEHVGKAYALFFLSEDGKTGRTAELTVAPKTDALSWVEELTVYARTQTSGTAAQTDMTVSLNGEQLADVNAYMDADGAAVRIPLLNEDYFKLDTSDVDPGDAALLLQALRASGLSREEVTALTKQALTCMVQGLDDVSKSRGTVEAEEISQRCTVLHVTISEDDAAGMREALVSLLRTDAAAQKLTAALADADTDADAWAERLADALVSGAAEGGEMDVSVAADGGVIGRELRLANDASFSFARPISLAKRTMGLAVRVHGPNANEISMRGTLQKDAGELTCDITADGDSDTLCTLSYSALEAGEDTVSADFRLALDDGAALLIPEKTIANAAKGMVLDGTLSAGDGMMDAAADVEMFGMDLAAFTLRQERVAGETVRPVTDAVSFEKWQKDIDVTSATKELTARLKRAGVPALTLAKLLLQVFDQGAASA